MEILAGSLLCKNHKLLPFFGRKVEIKKESEVWTSDSADFSNGGAKETRTLDPHTASVML